MNSRTTPGGRAPNPGKAQAKPKAKSTTRPFRPRRGLLAAAERNAQALSVPLRKGPVFSTDLFYSEDSGRYDRATMSGVLGVDMETSMLYAMAAHNSIQALSLLTVSDNLLTGAESSAEEREKQANDMVRLALEITLALPSVKS